MLNLDRLVNILNCSVYHVQKDKETLWCWFREKVAVSNKKCVLIVVPCMLQQLQKAWSGSLTYATAEDAASHMFTLMTYAYTKWGILNDWKERMWVPFFSLITNVLHGECVTGNYFIGLCISSPFDHWLAIWYSKHRVLHGDSVTGIHFLGLCIVLLTLCQLFRLQYPWTKIPLVTLRSDSGQKMSTTSLLMCLDLMDFSNSRWKCPSTTSFL